MHIGKVILSACVLLVPGCDAELAFGTGKIRSVISQVFVEQAMDNIGRFVDDKNAIPNQIMLASGTTQVQNGINTGIAPNIALRAIAITGLNLSSSNALQQSWATVPIVDFDKIARLQKLYNYAIPYDNGASIAEGAQKPFAAFEQAFSSIAPPVGNLSETISPLPDGPLIYVDNSGACAGNSTTASSAGHLICFRGDKPDPSAAKNGTTGRRTFSPENLKSLFVLWTMAATQVAALKEDKAVEQAAPGGKPAPGPARRGSRSPRPEPRVNVMPLVPQLIQPFAQ